MAKASNKMKATAAKVTKKVQSKKRMRNLQTTKKEQKKKEKKVNTVSNELIKSLHPLGEVPISISEERRHAGINQGFVVDYHSKWDLSHLSKTIKELRTKNPNENIFIMMGEQEAATLSDSAISFPVIYALIAPQGVMPPPFLRLKSVNGDDPITTFDNISVEWELVKDVLVPNKIGGKCKSKLLEYFDEKVCQNKVFVLSYSGRSLRNVDDEAKGKFMRPVLLDCRPTVFPEYHKTKAGHQQIEVQSAPFKYSIGGRSFSDVYSKGCTGMDVFINDIIESQRANGASQLDYDAIKQAIKDGFAAKRQDIQAISETIMHKYRGEELENMRIAKVYPSNIDEVVPLAVKQMKAARNFLKQVDQGVDPKSIDTKDVAGLLGAKELAKLDADATRFHYATSNVTAQYGPAADENIFPPLSLGSLFCMPSNNWKCNDCLLPNSSDEINCVCCGASRPGIEGGEQGETADTAASSSVGIISSAGFMFGSGTIATATMQSTEPSSAEGSTGSAGFIFGGGTTATATSQSTGPSPAAGFKIGPAAVSGDEDFMKTD